MEYEDIDRLLADLHGELRFPNNVKTVLEKNEPLCMWVVNLVNALMAARLGHVMLCGADNMSMLYKYCRHRQTRVCGLYDEECRFKRSQSKGGDNDKAKAFP